MLPLHKRLVGLVYSLAVAALILGWSAPVRAAIYAYSVQQTSGYTFTGATVGTLSPNSSSSAAQTAVPSGSDAHSGIADALESYVGPPAGKPAENTFTPKGQTTADYSRGDALVTVAPAAVTTNNAAEMFLTNIGNASGAGAWSISAPVTVAESNTLSVTFNYSNLLNIVNSGSPPGTVQANYSYNMSVQDAGGSSVFTSSPIALNRSVSLVTAGLLNLPGSGQITISTGSLASGTYTLTLSGTENVFGNLVPEPTGCMMIGLLFFGIIGRRQITERPVHS